MILNSSRNGDYITSLDVCYSKTHWKEEAKQKTEWMSKEGGLKNEQAVLNSPLEIKKDSTLE